jgi:hypothetical protein
MNKKNNLNCPLKEKFKKIEQNYMNLRMETNNVKTDFEMMNEGWNINFAVDFHQIYQFLDRKQISSENTNKISIWHKAASTFIFSQQEEIKRTFILPSHLIELRNFIVRIKEMSKNRVISDYNTDQDLLEECEIKKLKQANSIYQKGDVLGDKLMSDIIQLIKTKFLPLYRLISGELRNEFIQINNLFQHISLITKCWDPKIVALIQKENMKSVIISPWYNSFLEIRTSKDRIVNNVRDAKAIDSVMALNKYFQEKGESEIVLLVSDAESMRKVLNWDKDDEVRRKWMEKNHRRGVINLDKFGEIRILRTSDSFFAYLLNKSNIKDQSKRRFQTIQNLDSQLKKLNNLSITQGMIRDEFEKCSNICKNSKKESWCRKIENDIEKFEKEFQNITLFSMVAEAKKLIESQLGEFSKISPENLVRLDNVKSMVEFLLLEKKDFDERIRKEIEDLNKQVDEILYGLINDIIKGLSFESFKEMSYKLRRLRGIPYAIQFHTDKIKDSLDDFFTLMDEYQSLSPEKEQIAFDHIRKKWKDIIDLTEDESVGIERKLLQAGILFSYKLYHDTLAISKEVSIELQKYPEVEKEFRLIECLTNYRIFRNKKINRYFELADEICKKGLTNYSSDARFLNMAAILEVTESSSEENIKRALKHLKDAENILQNRKIKEDKNVQITILNNTVYITLKSTDINLSDITKLEIKISQIEQLSPRDDWDADLWHTEGVLLKKKGILIQSPEKITLFKRAIENFEIALKDVKEYDLDKYRREVFNQDLQEVKLLLEESSCHYS